MKPDELEILEKQQADLLAQIDALNEQKSQIELGILHLVCPFKPGDIIEKKSGYLAGRFRVLRLRYRYKNGSEHRYELAASKIRKDGSEGQNVTICWPEEYERVDE